MSCCLKKQRDNMEIKYEMLMALKSSEQVFLCLTAGLSGIFQSGIQKFLQRNRLLLKLPAGQTVGH